MAEKYRPPQEPLWPHGRLAAIVKLKQAHAPSLVGHNTR